MNKFESFLKANPDRLRAPMPSQRGWYAYDELNDQWFKLVAVNENRLLIEHRGGGGFINTWERLWLDQTLTWYLARIKPKTGRYMRLYFEDISEVYSFSEDRDIEVLITDIGYQP